MEGSWGWDLGWGLGRMRKAGVAAGGVGGVRLLGELVVPG